MLRSISLASSAARRAAPLVVSCLIAVSAPSQTPSETTAVRVVAPFSAEATRYFEAISDPYALGGELIRTHAPGRVPLPSLEFADERLRELAALEGEISEVRTVHDALLEAVKLNSALSTLAFAGDLQRRVGEAVRDREDAPPIELIGDAYERQNQTLALRILELTARHSGLSLTNLVADKLRAYADEQQAPSTEASATRAVKVDFVSEGDKRGFVRLRNRTGRAIPGCLVVVKLVPDPERVREIRAIEDFGLLPVLFGGSIDDVEARKELNQLNLRFLGTAQSKAVWIEQFPASGVVEFPPNDSQGFFQLAQSCEVALWPTGFQPQSLVVPGLSKVQDRPDAAIPAKSKAGAGQAKAAGPSADPRREIEQLKQRAAAEPVHVLERLRALRTGAPADSELSLSCETLRKAIVAEYQEKQRANTAAIKQASAEQQKANEDWAADPGNQTLRSRHAAAKKRVEDLKLEGGRIRQVLGAR